MIKGDSYIPAQSAITPGQLFKFLRRHPAGIGVEHHMGDVVGRQNLHVQDFKGKPKLLAL